MEYNRHNFNVVEGHLASAAVGFNSTGIILFNVTAFYTTFYKEALDYLYSQ